MNKEQIRAAIERGAPFTLQLADGRSFEIPHEDYIAVPPSGSSVFVFEDSGYYHVLSLRLIANLTGQTDTLDHSPS